MERGWELGAESYVIESKIIWYMYIGCFKPSLKPFAWLANKTWYVLFFWSDDEFKINTTKCRCLKNI